MCVHLVHSCTVIVLDAAVKYRDQKLIDPRTYLWDCYTRLAVAHKRQLGLNTIFWGSKDAPLIIFSGAVIASTTVSKEWYYGRYLAVITVQELLKYGVAVMTKPLAVWQWLEYWPCEFSSWWRGGRTAQEETKDRVYWWTSLYCWQQYCFVLFYQSQRYSPSLQWTHHGYWNQRWSQYH